jgi:hypothetical protein
MVDGARPAALEQWRAQRREASPARRGAVRVQDKHGRDIMRAA